MHNGKYDLQILANTWPDFKFNGKLWDTLSASRLLNDDWQSHELDTVGGFYSGASLDGEFDSWKAPVKALLRKEKARCTREGHPSNYYNYSALPEAILREYALLDIWYTFVAYQMMHEDIEEEYPYLFQLEMDCISVIISMERRGVSIDRPRAKLARNLIRKRLKELYSSFREQVAAADVASLNPRSPKQLMETLLELGVEKRLLIYKKKASCCAEVLGRVSALNEGDARFDWISTLLEIKAYEKIASTYFGALLKKTSRGPSIIHCNIKPSDTRTGRSACADPNLQNIPDPKKSKLDGDVPTVRSVFICRSGFRNWYFDYSQIEMRVFAVFAQEREMLEAFSRGDDLHAATARMVFRDYEANPDLRRKHAKGVNFGLIYGEGIDSLGIDLGLTFDEAKALRSGYLARFPAIDRFLRLTKRELYNSGYCEDMFGRKYHLPMNLAYRMVNRLVQGASANVLKQAEVQVTRLIDTLGLEEEIYQLLPIHDEQQIEISERAYRDNPLLPYLIKLASEDIPLITQYDMVTECDIEYSDTSWEAKTDFELNEGAIVEARNEYARLRRRIIYDIPIEKVSWFLN